MNVSNIFVICICLAFAGCNSPLCGKHDPDYPQLEVYRDARVCARREAAELAPGPDSADVIAAAVQDLCFPQAESTVEARQPPYTDEELAILKAGLKAATFEEARIEVLRRRARHCPAP